MTPVALSGQRTATAQWALIRAVGLLLIGLGLATGAFAMEEDPELRWQQIRSSLFGERPLQEGGGVIELDTPYRAMDAAIVPIEIRSRIEQTPARYIKRLYIVIDMNPSPVAAVFKFPGQRSWDRLSTRVRVNAYTNLRAVAETSDGELYMTSNFVKASGGCSAPSLKDPAAAQANLGRMKLVLPNDFSAGDPLSAQILIKHPNSSGLQFDQISRQFIAPDYVRTIEVSYNDETLFTVDADISISEDPSINFNFVADGEGELRVRVTDSNGREFDNRFTVAPHG